MKKLILVCSLIALAACTKPEATERLLAREGYTDVKITGYSFFACSDSETFHTGFVARLPNGNMVSGTVCSGWLIGNNIRID